MTKKEFSAAVTGDALTVMKYSTDYAGFTQLRSFICGADLRLTNLETVISDYNCFPSTFCGGTWINARPDTLETVLEYGINCVTCANNHAMDYSFDGLRSTMRELKRAGLPFAGIGESREEAVKPAIINAGGMKIGVISACSSLADVSFAGRENGNGIPSRPGLAPLRFSEYYEVEPRHMEYLREIEEAAQINGEINKHIKDGFRDAPPENTLSLNGNISFTVGKNIGKHTRCHAGDLEYLLRALESAKAECDAVFVSLHAHQSANAEHTVPAEFAVEFAHAAVDAGAAGLIGTGTHHLKPVEIYKGKPMFYSLGNFIYQSALLEKLPYDFAEKFHTPMGDAEMMLSVRSRGGTRGLTTQRGNYLTVVPKMRYEDGRLTELTLLPLSLGFELSGEEKGRPRPADEKTALEICRNLNALSAPYATEFVLKNGLISINL